MQWVVRPNGDRDLIAGANSCKPTWPAVIRGTNKRVAGDFAFPQRVAGDIMVGVPVDLQNTDFRP